MSKRKSETSLRGDDQSQKFKHERQRQAYIDNMHNFWQKQLDKIKNTDFKNLKQHDLPLARIKKIMRSDEDVKMISAEAPVLFAKACELFILDLTMRAWSHADANRRRTLQREDVAAAISDSDMFDFLLDVVPRQTVDQNKESIDSSAVAQLASKNAQVGSEELEPSDHRLRRPILNPLTPNQTPIDMIMPVPVDSKSQDQTSLEHLPDTSQRRDWPISGQNSFNRMLLGPATTEASLATGSASLSANLQSSGAPSTANQPPGGAPI